MMVTVGVGTKLGTAVVTSVSVSVTDGLGLLGVLVGVLVGTCVGCTVGGATGGGVILAGTCVRGGEVRREVKAVVGLTEGVADGLITDGGLTD